MNTFLNQLRVTQSSSRGAPVWLLSLIAAVSVIVSYLPQPLLGLIAQDFRVGSASVGWVATSVQFGYAAGMIVFLPLADIVRPRVQIQCQLIAVAFFLALAALAQQTWQLVAAMFLAGLFSNVAQIIIPLAIRFSPPELIGRTSASLSGALLFGVFGGRILAGAFGQEFGWRVPVLGLALLLLLLIPVVRFCIATSTPAPTQARYASLMRSLVTLVMKDAALRESSAIQFLVFAGFNALWTVSVLYLTDPTIGWSTAQAALVGLVGILAGVLTQLSGSIVDRWGNMKILLAATGLGALSALAIAFGERIVAVIVLGLFALTLANQLTQVANQARILRTPSLAGRINTIYMSMTFLGGALGSAAGSLTFAHGGISFTAIVVSAAVALAMLISLIAGSGARGTGQPMAR